MDHPYSNSYKLIQNALNAKNYKLAVKLWKNMQIFAERSNNKTALKGCRKLKKRITDEITYDKAIKTFAKAKSEFNHRNLESALNLSKKAKDLTIQSEIMQKKLKKQRLIDIEEMINTITQKIK